MSDTAIKSALRRSLHFENINSGNIGKMSDTSYYKFFIYDNNNFLEVEIMGGKILSARYSGPTNKSITIKLSNDLGLGIIDSDENNKFIPKTVDIEYSFGLFTLSSNITFKDNTKIEKTINAGESKYYGALVSDASNFANTLEVGNVNLGKGSTLTVDRIKLGKWNIDAIGEDTINITHGV